MALRVGTDCYNEMTSYIKNMKTKSLPPPGPVLDILKQWYTADKELHTDTRLAVAASKGVKDILNNVVVRRTKPSGKLHIICTTIYQNPFFIAHYITGF